MTTILVTGGTGTLGRRHPATAGGRARGKGAQPDAQPYAVDLRAGGSGLDAAVAGVDTVVHCASSPRGGTSRRPAI
ncbi:hypothetical protein SGLAM104S_01116 [Streptomyces glaucescens]